MVVVSHEETNNESTKLLSTQQMSSEYVKTYALPIFFILKLRVRVPLGVVHPDTRNTYSSDILC